MRTRMGRHLAGEGGGTMRRSVSVLPLHYGRAPSWLFEKMKRLSAAIMEIIVLEFGPEEFLARVADPIWFQAMGCVVGFDWHSSGVTTTLCGALKEGLSSFDDDFPVAVCGGKAKRAIATPQELSAYGEKWGVDVSPFIEMSRLCAKIDNAAIQDGYSLYHHVFFLTKGGEWAIVQQGMSGEKKTARRYQWLSREHLDVVSEPHTGITCNERDRVLNFVAKESLVSREAVVEFSREDPDNMAKTWKKIALEMPRRHYITAADIDEKRLIKTWRMIHESQPETFKDLIALRGVGPRTISALALVSELVYEAPPSFNDPARFGFAHGGKDGHPFPVDKKTYESSIEFLKSCLDKACVGDKDKLNAFRRLSRF